MKPLLIYSFIFICLSVARSNQLLYKGNSNRVAADWEQIIIKIMAGIVAMHSIAGQEQFGIHKWFLLVRKELKK